MLLQQCLRVKEERAGKSNFASLVKPSKYTLRLHERLKHTHYMFLSQQCTRCCEYRYNDGFSPTMSVYEETPYIISHNPSALFSSHVTSFSLHAPTSASPNHHHRFPPQPHVNHNAALHASSATLSLSNTSERSHRPSTASSLVPNTFRRCACVRAVVCLMIRPHRARIDHRID